MNDVIAYGSLCVAVAAAGGLAWTLGRMLLAERARIELNHALEWDWHLGRVSLGDLGPEQLEDGATGEGFDPDCPVGEIYREACRRELRRRGWKMGEGRWEK